MSGLSFTVFDNVVIELGADYNAIHSALQSKNAECDDIGGAFTLWGNVFGIHAYTLVMHSSGIVSNIQVQFEGCREMNLDQFRTASNLIIHMLTKALGEEDGRDGDIESSLYVDWLTREATVMIQAEAGGGNLNITIEGRNL